jgi:endonuclease/exonuclease/phosphatase family metal-dependent hydrolase
MKLVQLNAWHFRLEHQIYDFLKSQAADITCLQEVISIKGDSGMFGSIERLQTITGETSVFVSPEVSFNLMNRVASYGNAILSRYPILETRTIFTNLEHKSQFDFDTDDYNVRNLQHAVIRLGDKKVHVLNHHGYHVPNHKDGNEETLRQMEQIGEYLDSLEGPIILTGDFNLAPHSESLEQINRRLHNLSISYKLKTTRTSLTHKTEVCDYIFVNDAVRVKDFHASDELVSDHKALILEFDLA